MPEPACKIPHMVYATMCLVRQEDNTLFIQRSGGETDIHHGFYVFPGGKCEPGERGAACVQREVKEETGLTVINPRLRATVRYDNRKRLMGGKTGHPDWFVEVYETSQFRGELTAEHEQAQLHWVKDAHLSRIQIYPGDREIITRLAREERKGIYSIVVSYDGESLKRFEYSRIN